MMAHQEKVGLEEHKEIEDFIFMEARLADESNYSAWEELVEDDMVYWVPRGDGEFSIDDHVSITADNRERLANRIKQLKSGLRYAQVPASPMRRIISNIEIFPRSTHIKEYDVKCNFVVYEMRIQTTNKIEIWPGRVEYGLRWTEFGLKMFSKKVILINGDTPIPSVAFIL
jgi:3-phenylpropionate/cinnamic acid dioxygenase small subunit